MQHTNELSHSHPGGGLAECYFNKGVRIEYIHRIIEILFISFSFSAGAGRAKSKRVYLSRTSHFSSMYYCVAVRVLHNYLGLMRG